MDTIFHIYIIGIILLIIGGIIYLFLRHQRNLKSRAFLMQEAIRNGDYSFRLSTKGLLSGERALQQASTIWRTTSADWWRSMRWNLGKG